MSNHFRTPEDYEFFLYSLIEEFPAVKRSTITFIRIGSSLARVAGEIYFDNDIRLVVRERVLYHRLPIIHLTPLYEQKQYVQNPCHVLQKCVLESGLPK